MVVSANRPSDTENGTDDSSEHRHPASAAIASTIVRGPLYLRAKNVMRASFIVDGTFSVRSVVIAAVDRLVSHERSVGGEGRGTLLGRETIDA